MNDPVEAALYRVHVLISQFDPELMKQVVESHPKLAQKLLSACGSLWSYKGSDLDVVECKPDDAVARAGDGELESG